MNRFLPLFLLIAVAGCSATGPMTPSPPSNAAPPVSSQGEPMRTVLVSEYDATALDYPPLRDVALPAVERVELPSGLVVFLAEDHTLPMVHVSARIGAGALWEPAGKVGLASITGQVMRSGGAGTMSPDEVNEALENLGARVEVAVGDDAAFASMSTLKEHVGAVLPVLVSILTAPRFDAEQVELAKTRARSSISRRNDDPQGIAVRELFKLVYGAESPYARTTEYWTIDAITRDDLVDFHAQYFHPNNAYLAAWGDFDADQMARKIREAFAEWERAEGFERPEPPMPEAERQKSIAFIEKDDVTQSTVLIGHPGEIRLDHPDYFAVTVMNEILGGGFSSRLFQRVRSDLGLAYAVFGVYTADYLTPGVFYSGTFTQSGRTVEAARAMLDVIESMRTRPPSEQELAQAKDAYLNSFVFNFDTKGEVLNRQMTYAYYGYPDDFIQRIKEGVEAVTAADVQRVAQQYLHPDEARILVLGNAEDFGEPVSALGSVETIDVTIPLTAPGAPAETPAGDADAGGALLGRVLDALGGADAFAEVEAIRYAAESAVEMGGQSVTIKSEVTVQMPDQIHAMQQTPMGTFTLILNGDQGVVQAGGANQPAPPALVNQLRAQLYQDLPYLLGRADDLTASVLEARDGLEILRITAPGVDGPILLYVDPETARPVRQQMTVVGMQGPQETLVFYEDYRAAGPLTLPYTTRTVVGGEESGRSTYTAIEINPAIEAGFFDAE